MLTVGLTGGIGAGKSAVAAALARRGAAVIDTDVLAREVIAPGTPGFDAVLDRFGPDVLAPDGSVDRARLASVVFAAPAARADLEAIVHPAVRAAVAERLAGLERAGARVALVVVPLLVETGPGRYGLDRVLVVDAPEDVALERLTAGRGMAEQDARARIAAQATRTERLRAADYVLVNVGTLDELDEMAGCAWRWIEGLLAPRGAGAS